MTDQLAIWTIFNKPLDMPDAYVARKFLIGQQPVPTDEMFSAQTLDEVRGMLPEGLFRLERNPADDPVIVESWV